MKRRGFLISFFVVSLVVSGIVIYIQQTNTEVLNISREEITRIYIVDGNTGNMIDVEKNDYDEVYESLDNLKLSNKKKVDSTGWNKKIVICGDKNTEELIINSSTRITISGYYYDIDSKQGEKILNIIGKILQ